MKSRSPFYFSYFLLVITLVGIFLNNKYWETKKVIDWDVSQYYSYLPATFLYKDYTFQNADTLWEEAHFKLLPLPDGVHTYPVKMTYGVSLFYAPFFVAAHSFCLNSQNCIPNGFSKPYKIALLLSSLVFALIGLWFFGNWLLNYVSPIIAAIATLCIFAGTNLAYFTFVEPVSHVYGFALISTILYCFSRYLREQKTSLVIIIGFLSGLFVLIRPTNIILLLFLLIMLWLKRSQLDSKKLKQHILIAIPLAAIVWIPQFIYWKHMTGQWLFYSYNDESFFFTDPEIWKGLFSYRKGWFVYSPLLFLAIPGFWFLHKQKRHTAIAALITLFVGLCVTFCWRCWWYGGGFGARAMIEYLPFMGLALAMLFQASGKAKLLVSIPVFVLATFLCVASVWFTHLYTKLYIHPDSMSKELFWKQIMTDELAKNYFNLIDPADYDKAKRNEEF